MSLWVNSENFLVQALGKQAGRDCYTSGKNKQATTQDSIDSSGKLWEPQRYDRSCSSLGSFRRLTGLAVLELSKSVPKLLLFYMNLPKLPLKHPLISQNSYLYLHVPLHLPLHLHLHLYAL